MDADGKECEPDKLGKIVMKRPLPPGSMIDIVCGNKEEVLKEYFDTVPDYFYAGDSGCIDENGYIKV